MRLCHIADVHWRGLHRHDEYKRAFTRMFDELRAIRPDAIVICGDIVHSKTQGISPELIEHLRWWFNEMIAICDVHVTLGNHDGNLMNMSRLDAISPIVNAINDPRLKLYKKSGVYPIADGFNLCVFSIFDEDGWATVKPAPGVNIAVYHGSVAGSKTDMGWELESERETSFFDGFDFVFLGDIHKRQYLAERDGKPWIAYSGSTIMQDYGEEPGKGYLLWDIRSRDDFDVEFHPVEHDQEFYTIDWAGSLRATIDVAKALPRGSRIRIRADSPISQVEARQITTELMALHGASEVVFKDEAKVDGNTIATDDVQVQKNDLRDVDVLLKLFRAYFGPDTFSEDQWGAIKGLIERYMARINQEEVTVRNVRWRPRKLWFDNTFGYGEKNYINFDDLSGIVGIFGPNTIGKSSVIGTLMYTLFNGSDRGSLKNLHIINSRKNHCRTKLAFSIDSTEYVVERQSVRHETRAGMPHAVTSLNLFEVDREGNILKDLNGEQRTDTEKVLRTLIGTQEDMLLTSIAAQGEMNAFVDAGSSYRDQVMSRFLDLIFFERMSQLAKDDSSDLKFQVKNAPDRDWSSQITTAENELARHASEITRIERVLKEKRVQLDGLKAQLATGFSNSVTRADVDALRKKVEGLRQSVAALDESKAKSQVLARDIESKLSTVRVEIASIPVDELKENLRSISAIKETISALKQTYEKERQVLVGQEKSIKRLLEVPCGDSFPSCKYIRDSHADKAKIEEQRVTVEGLLAKIDETQVSLAGLHAERIEEQLLRHGSLLKKETDLVLGAMKAKQDLERIDRSINDYVAEQLEHEMRLVDYLSRVVEDDGSEGLKRQISELEDQIDELDSKRVKSASRKGSLMTELTRLRSEKDRFEKIKSEWYVYEMFIQATSKKGIPSQIIHAQLPIINAEIARILHGVVDFTLRFEKDDDSNSTEIYIDYGDSKRLIELGSGMEKMISSLAIRVALQNASSLPKPDFIVIDEGFGTLDETKIDACNRMLIALKKWFKSIIVISHIDAIKDVADNIIEVVRTDKNSRVYYE